MRIRINIPAWGWSEFSKALLAVTSGNDRDRFRKRLLLDVQSLVPSRVPYLVSSARFGLALAARALGLEGRRVAVPGYVCPAVLTGLKAARVEPVAVDCEFQSIRFNSKSLADTVHSGAVAGIVAPNSYGLDQDFSTLSQFGLPVIEDAAYQAGRLGSQGSKLCGVRGDAGVWSFNFKALTSIGGGVLFVREDAGCIPWATVSKGQNEIPRFINYALRSLGRHRIPSFLPGAEAPAEEPENETRDALLALRETTMSELQAAVAVAQWGSRDDLDRIQTRNSSMLAVAVARCAALAPLAYQQHQTMVHLYPVLIQVPPEDAVAAVHAFRRSLHARRVQTETPYPISLGSVATLPNSHDLARRLVLVPCNASLGERQMDWIVRTVETAGHEIEEKFRPPARNAESVNAVP